jgi:hypothetical protein
VGAVIGVKRHSPGSIVANTTVDGRWSVLVAGGGVAALFVLQALRTRIMNTT